MNYPLAYWHQHISFRPLELSDIPHVVDYWYRSPPSFYEGMNVDISKFPDEERFASKQAEKTKIDLSRPQNIESLTLAILFDGQFIGNHVLGDVTYGKSGLFHAHIMKEEYRGKSLGVYTYPRACEYYFKFFNLEEIIFKSPVMNPGPNRIKEKLGIPCLGQLTLELPILKSNTIANLYKLQRPQLEQILLRQQQDINSY